MKNNKEDNSIDISTVDLDSLADGRRKDAMRSRLRGDTIQSLRASLDNIKESNTPVIKSVVKVVQAYAEWGGYKNRETSNRADADLFSAIQAYVYDESTMKILRKIYKPQDMEDSKIDLVTFLFMALTKEDHGCQTYSDVLKYFSKSIDRSRNGYRKYNNYIGDKTREIPIGDGYDFKVGDASRNQDPSDYVRFDGNKSDDAINLAHLLQDQLEGTSNTSWGVDAVTFDPLSSDDDGNPEGHAIQKERVIEMLSKLEAIPTLRASGALGNLLKVMSVLDMPGNELNLAERRKYASDAGRQYSDTGTKIEIDKGYRIFRELINSLE